MTTLPPLRALQAFEALGRLGSVKRAAAELGVTAGAVSQQIRKTEDILGLRLVDRKGKGVELTVWGRDYHARIEAAFDQLRKAQAGLDRQRHDSGIAISCLPSLAIKWLGPLLLDWQAGHADANIRLTGAESEPRLDDGESDFRLSYGRAAHGFEQHVELFTDTVVPACAPALLARHGAGTPADILTLPLLGIEWGGAHRAPPGWADWARSIGAPYAHAGGEIAFSLSSAAIDAAINGRGYVLGQLSMIADDLASNRLVMPFDKRLPLPEPYYLAWSRTALEKPFGADLRQWIVTVSRQQGARSAGAPDAARS